MNLLIVSTLSFILLGVMPNFIRFILSYAFAQKRCNEDELRNEWSDLKEEMTGLSMVNEFARYARLQRKCNQLESILKENMNQRLISKLKLETFLIYSFFVLDVIFISYLLTMYATEPVIILSEGMLWPFQDLLGWPCQHENAISLLMWQMITLFALSAYKQLRSSELI